MEDKNNKRQFSEVFRWITPVTITIGIFILGGIQSTVKDIDIKLFRHLTNDELHPPKSCIVDKTEFAMYQKLRDSQLDKIDESICEIKEMIRNLYSERNRSKN